MGEKHDDLCRVLQCLGPERVRLAAERVKRTMASGDEQPVTML